MKPQLVAPLTACDDAVAPVWSEWGRMTRFLESARLALAREHSLWSTLELHSAEDVKLSSISSDGTYKATVPQHLAAVRDEEMLLASVLIHSYALAESAAAEHLRRDAREFRGIEDWGTELLVTTGSSWDSLKGGLAGAVEIAVVRNAYAHGDRRIDRLAAKRLRAFGVTCLEDEPIVLDYARLKVFRGRLRGLLTAGGVGQGTSSGG